MHRDEEEIHWKPGDVVIPRGTIHNRFNRGIQPSVMAVVLIATEDGKWAGW